METQAFTVVCESIADQLVPPCTAAVRGAKPRLSLGFGKILIVDDNDIDQLRATVLSNDLGATVEVVSSGRHALKALESSHDVRLVLMDCEMPDMSGMDTTRQWRRVERGRRSAIPIVGLSRRGAADYVRCIAAGMNDTLSKPLTRDAVERCFERWTQSVLPTDSFPARTLSYEDENAR